MNWPEFIAMGQYGFYIWTSYAAAAVVLLVNIALPLRRRRTVRRQLEEFYRLQKESE